MSLFLFLNFNLLIHFLPQKSHIIDSASVVDLLGLEVSHDFRHLFWVVFVHEGHFVEVGAGRVRNIPEVITNRQQRVRFHVMLQFILTLWFGKEGINYRRIYRFKVFRTVIIDEDVMTTVFIGSQLQWTAFDKLTDNSKLLLEAADPRESFSPFDQLKGKKGS